MTEEVFEITEDLMLDGLKIVQDKRYYRFTSDSITLSRFASVKKGEIAADFCAGSGIVGLHYYGLHKDMVKSVDLFELQPELCRLSKKSIELNGLQKEFALREGKLQEADKSLNGKYTLILCNPPYKKKDSGESGLSTHIAICRHEKEITLEEIVITAKRLLAPSGRLCICQRIERLTDLFVTLRANGLEPYRLAFVRNVGDAPYLFLCEAVKDKKRTLTVEKDYVNSK